MALSVDAIETCLRELDAARGRVSRMRSVQITRAVDRDNLKAVAYAWFQSHRPQLAGTVADETLGPVDASLKMVLESTNRSAARSTYLKALKEAKDALLAVRGMALVPPAAAQGLPDKAPDFSPLASDQVMKAILERRWIECCRCIQAGVPLAATVMMGGLLETLFVARANIMPNKGPLFSATKTPKDKKTGKALELSQWTLSPYIDVAHELGWISKPAADVAGVLREYRNYVHPEKERSHGVHLSSNDAAMFWDLTKSLATQLLNSALLTRVQN